MKMARLLMMLCAGLAGLAGPARALDFVKSPPPAEVTDGLVTLGDRKVVLPAGKWTFVSYAKGTYVRGAAPAVTRHSGYFVNTSEKNLLAGLVVETGEYAFSMTQWNDDSCKAEGKVFKSLLESTVLFPECLVINKRASSHKGATAAFFRQVSDWAESQHIDQSVAVYDIIFHHYSSSGQGLVRLLIPASKFQSEAAVIDLAKRLPDLFRPFFQGRVNEVVFPALP